MRFFTVAVSLFAALAAATSGSSSSNGDNAFISPTSGTVFTAGQSTTLEWTPTTSGTVSLRLQWGAETTATEGVAIASAIDNTGSFTWTVPANIPVEADYFIRIGDDDDTSIVNYSARFAISGVTGSATTTTAVSSTTVMSTSSSSSTTVVSTTMVTTTSTSSSASSTTVASTTVASSSAVPSSTTSSSSTSSAASTTSSSAKASATTTVPNTNGVVSIKVPSFLMGAVALGAFALL